MPVKKVNSFNNHNIVVKTLRRRQVSCIVPAVIRDKYKHPTNVQFENPSMITTSDGSKDTTVKIKRSYRKRNSQSTTPAPRPNKSSSVSAVVLSEDSYLAPQLTNEISDKRAVRKKSLPKKLLEDFLLWDASLDKVEDTPSTPIVQTTPKRVYRKKVNVVPPNTPVTVVSIYDTESTCNSTLSQASDLTPFSGFKKIHEEPQNTSVTVVHMSDTESACTSLLGQSNYSPSILDCRRKRGRPPGPSREKQTVQTISAFSFDEDLTCTSSTTLSIDSDVSKPRRPRRSRWTDIDCDDGQEEEEVSEYELQRRKNIEENLQMLRQMLNDCGLPNEHKPSETTNKSRKNYSRLPLPPPRPKSTRIEVRRSFHPLDFSKFSHRLSMTD